MKAILIGLAVYVFACGLTTVSARADGGSTPPAAVSVPASTSVASTTTNSEKPIMLEQFEVSGLRERMAIRQQTITKNGWGTAMCLDDGSVIDNIVFLCEYKLHHQAELVRLVMWQNVDGITNPFSNHMPPIPRFKSYEEGMGPIIDSHRVDNVAVYTFGDELHVRRTLLGDRVYPFYKASDIRKLSDKQLVQEAYVMINNSPPVGSLRTGTTAMPNSVPGDDANLQVYYAQSRLKEIGTTAIVVPAMAKTGPNNDKMLIFQIDHIFFVWRPYYGTFRLKKEALARFGLPLEEIAASKQEPNKQP